MQHRVNMYRRIFLEFYLIFSLLIFQPKLWVILMAYDLLIKRQTKKATQNTSSPLFFVLFENVSVSQRIMKLGKNNKKINKINICTKNIKGNQPKRKISYHTHFSLSLVPFIRFRKSFSSLRYMSLHFCSVLQIMGNYKQL